MSWRRTVALVALAAAVLLAAAGCAELLEILFPTTPPDGGTSSYGVVMGTVVGAGGADLGGVSVSVGSRTTTSNDQGWFSLSELAPGSNLSVVFRKSGYATTHRRATVPAGGSTFLEVAMTPVEASGTFDAASGALATTADGAVVTIPANAIVTGTGAPYNGPVSMTLTSFDPTDESEMLSFPGEYVGVSAAGTTVPIKSFGFIDVTLADPSGQPLQLAPGQTSTITVPVPLSMRAEAEALGSCPLWYFDVGSGVWREEGQGTYNATQGAFVGTVSHFTTWNFDVSYPRAFISGRVIDSTGNPVEGAEIRCWGRGWTYARWESGETRTGADGRFHRIPVECTVIVNYRAQKGGHKSANLTTGPLECNMEYDVGDIFLDSPAMQAILTWGADPSDLDSHLVGPSQSGTFHVYYSSQGSLSAEPYANLDTDDVTGYGPEVVSISRTRAGTYRYSVRHFSGSGTIENSGARIELIIPTQGIRRFTPPAGQPSGTDIWRVFDLVIDAVSGISVQPIGDYVTGGDASPELWP